MLALFILVVVLLVAAATPALGSIVSSGGRSDLDYGSGRYLNIGVRGAGTATVNDGTPASR